MEIVLSQLARSFATRERAREIVDEHQFTGGDVTLDVHGVFASPSFCAELLVRLACLAGEVTVVTDAINNDKFDWLIQNLRLPNVRTRVAAA